MIVNSLLLPHSISEIVETFGIHHSTLTRLPDVNLEYLTEDITTRCGQLGDQGQVFNDFNQRKILEELQKPTGNANAGHIHILYRCIFGSEFINFHEI